MNTPLPALPRRKLPTGIQNLREIREGNFYYVDKSGLAIDLIESGKYFFLSRPRRFGKSLLVDTFKELFEGNRALFEGLAAETRWDWTKRYPVIRISFSDGVLHSRAELDERILDTLADNQMRLGVQCQRSSISGRFAELIQRVQERHGAPVVELAPKGQALQQIRDRGYADKYRGRGEPIHLVGVEFSRDSRNIVGFEVETLA
jgi:hypothetical protein